MRCLRLVAFLLALWVCTPVSAAPKHDFSTFQSFLRIALPGKITWSVQDFDRARGVQKLRLSQPLSVTQGRDLKEQLLATGELRWVVIDKEEVQIAYLDVRRQIIEVSEGVWALVVLRPTPFVLADYLDPAECGVWFSHLGQSVERLAQSLCASQGQVAIEGVLKGEDEFAKRLLDELMGPSPDFTCFHSELLTRPSLSQRSKLLLNLVEATHLLNNNSDILALERLRFIASSTPNTELEAVVIELGISTYSRLLEASLVRGEGAQALALYEIFGVWGKIELHPELALVLVQNLLAQERTADALDRVLVLLERDPNDVDALDLALLIYERLDLPYQAHLIKKRRKN